jgi:hypothetical protein
VRSFALPFSEAMGASEFPDFPLVLFLAGDGVLNLFFLVSGGV